MLQTSAIIFGFIVIFTLASGFIVLWHRGSEDLDAWGRFIARVLYGDQPSTQKPPIYHENYHKQTGLPRQDSAPSTYPGTNHSDKAG